MGKSAPSAPAAPDPTTTAQAQTASNQATALYNFGLNNPNTTTPLGSLAFTTDTSNPNEPATTEDITLSPIEQQLFNLNNQNVLQQGTNASTAQQNVTNQLATPYNVTGAAPAPLSATNQQQDLQNAQNALYQSQTQYLDPQFSQEQSQLQAQLANQGIPIGSAAYTTAMNNFANQKQQAYQSAMDSATSGGAAYQAQLSQTGLANQAQQAQLYTQQYQEPLNLYSSLVSGTQATLPQFSGVNTSSAAPTNVLGAYQNAYQGQLNAYNAQVGSANSQLSGATGLLGSLGSAAIMASVMASDIRVKTDIKRIGFADNGLKLYMFRYIGSDTPVIGFMAHEVEEIHPDAVVMIGGVKHVNLAKAIQPVGN